MAKGGLKSSFGPPNGMRGVLKLGLAILNQVQHQCCSNKTGPLITVFRARHAFDKALYKHARTAAPQLINLGVFRSCKNLKYIIGMLPPEVSGNKMEPNKSSKYARVYRAISSYVALMT